MPPSEPPSERALHYRRLIGNRIRAARLRRNLSQEGLAQLVGLDRKTMYRTELGQVAARIDWLVDIADALEVELADLVRRA